MKNMCNYILNLIFPKKCMFCHREGFFICEDCLSLIEINQIQYCNCFTNPQKNILKCQNCNKEICGVYTVLNSKQKIAKILFEKSQKNPELNLALSFLIISHLRDITISKNSIIIPQSKRVEKLAETLSEILKLNNNNENIIILSENYPFEIRGNKKATIVTLFRDI